MSAPAVPKTSSSCKKKEIIISGGTNKTPREKKQWKKEPIRRKTQFTATWESEHSKKNQGRSTGMGGTGDRGENARYVRKRGKKTHPF